MHPAGGDLAAGHGKGRGLAWPSSWVGCPLSIPITWLADQWVMMEHQVPRWCHSPHLLPFAAPQTDRPWHKVGGGDAPPQRGPSGNQRYFLVQGNICSCLSVQSGRAADPGPRAPPARTGQGVGIGAEPGAPFSVRLPPATATSRDSWPGATESSPRPPPRCLRLSLPSTRYRGSWGKHAAAPGVPCVFTEGPPLLFLTHRSRVFERYGCQTSCIYYIMINSLPPFLIHQRHP